MYPRVHGTTGITGGDGAPSTHIGDGETHGTMDGMTRGTADMATTIRITIHTTDITTITHIMRHHTVREVEVNRHTAPAHNIAKEVHWQGATVTPTTGATVPL